MPQVYDALMVGDKGLTLEAQQQLGDGVVRAIAMGPSEGVSRGLTSKIRGAHLCASRHGDSGPHHGCARQPHRREGPDW